MISLGIIDRYEAYRQSWPGDWSNEGTEYWVFDTDTCISLLADNRLTSHRPRLSDLAREANEVELASLFANWLMYVDGKEHAKHRRSAISHMKWDTPPPEIGFSGFADSIASSLESLTSIEVVSTLASPWAAHYVLGCCGIPMELVAVVEELAHEIVRLPGLSTVAVEDLSRAATAYRLIRSSLRDVRPIRGSIVEALLNAYSSEGEQLSAALMNVLIDGVHPTVAALSSVLILLPDNFERITSEDVARVLQLETPFQYVARIAMQPLEIHHKNIPAGTRVVLCIGASARCSQNSHQARDLTFGSGRHRCIGEGIARHCILGALQLLKRWAPRGYFIDGEVRWIASAGYRALIEARIQRNLV